jgi:hypothetical protein
MKKADNFDATKWLVENKITTQSKLNEAKKIANLDLNKLKAILLQATKTIGEDGGEYPLLEKDNIKQILDYLKYALKAIKSGDEDDYESLEDMYFPTFEYSVYLTPEQNKKWNNIDIALSSMSDAVDGYDANDVENSYNNLADAVTKFKI